MVDTDFIIKLFRENEEDNKQIDLDNSSDEEK